MRAARWIAFVQPPEGSDQPARYLFGVVPKMSLTPGRIWRGASAIGEDTTDVLSTLLGLSDPQIEKLYTDETVHRTEPFVEPQVEAANP